MEMLLSILERAGNPELSKECGILRSDMRRCEDGLVSVGLKIHIMPEARQFFDQLMLGIDEHNKRMHNLGNMFRASKAWLTLVLPPVGSATAAIRLVNALEHFVGTPLFGNVHTQIQVCAPGRLPVELCAILGVGFYLSSERIRSYAPTDLRTTVSNDDYYRRGDRLVLYDAYGISGEFDGNFPWWNAANGSIVVTPRLPFERMRTDVLVGVADPQDIRNVNLIASLLVHYSYHGAWAQLGSWFVSQVRLLLNEHQLGGILSASWVTPTIGIGLDAQEVHVADRVFAGVLDELSWYALGEAERCEKHGAHDGILHQMQEIMQFARYCVKTHNITLDQRGDAA